MRNAANPHRGKHATGLPTVLARTAFGVLRPTDATDIFAHPSPEFHRLTERGVLHRLATGYYAVVPAAARGDRWLPGLESAAYGIAAADYGADVVVPMGLSAARLHGALPRAVTVAVVAVPKQRPILTMADRDAQVVFVRRDTHRLDAERVTTDLGTALVTGVEQTVLDLAHRPTLGGISKEARFAVAALWPRCSPRTIEKLAREQRLRAALDRARGWAGESHA